MLPPSRVVLISLDRVLTATAELALRSLVGPWGSLAFQSLQRLVPLSRPHSTAVLRAHGPWTVPSSLNVSATLSWATHEFKTAGVPEPEASASYLLIHAMALPPTLSSLGAVRGQEVADDARRAFGELCARRARREPVQYLVGSWDFHRITLEVESPILIPRPETEELVEYVLEELRGLGPLRLLDVGVGTGAIGLALLHALPQASCVGIDTNPQVLKRV
jgi:HemK-like putative methylase